MKEKIIKFEEDIASIYEEGRIHAPIHLRSGNEQQLIKIFQEVNKEDYVFSTWASHSHALLKGVPPERVKQDILEGRSITLNYPEHNFYSSAIVGGVAPIALGVAKALSLNATQQNRVYCFVGDMGFHAGIVNECIRYSLGHDLAITWVIEDNKKSVGTDTEATCGILTLDLYNTMIELREKCSCKKADLLYYCYTNPYPHSGTGVFVEF